MKITAHALIRYMERVLNFDFTDLKVHFAVERGLNSCRFSSEQKDFVQWLDANVGLGEFKHRLTNLVWNSLDQKTQNKLNKSKNADSVVQIGDFRYVLKDDSLVTILPI